VSLTVTLPADTTPGSHTITLEGEAPDGTPRLVVYTIEVVPTVHDQRNLTVRGDHRHQG
jgi:hypothetical protein